ncbi:MAG: major capsid protein [Rhodocyclaceae bacterium]|nr:major capsid protein [Rhodocyclaceae bacterium]
MPQMTLAQARVINPVLTSIAQGIQQNSLIGAALFPMVDVGQRAGNIITFGREDFMQYSGLVRSPGGATKRVQVGYSGSTYALVDYSLEGSLPIETMQEAEASANGFSVDMASVTLQKTISIMSLRLEIAQAALATTLGNYPAANRTTLTGTAQWSDYSGTSSPAAVVETGKEAIRAATGKRPNVLVLGPIVFARLRQHPQIRDYIKYANREVATTAILAEFFGVQQVLVGDGVQATDAGVLSDIWGRHAILAYTETATLANLGAPTFGYTYNLSGYPLVEEPYFDRQHKTWFFPVTRSEAPVIAASSAGYFIQNAVA